jgi:hypothetical protein
VLGERHPTTLAATTNLALDIRAVGRIQEARTDHTNVFHRYQRIFGETHPTTVGAADGIRAICDIDTLPL